MKKVIIFALTLALALGGIGYAHAAVTDSQDELVIYPTLEIGDLSVLEGETASMTFACGNHLRWYTDYTFGSGLTEAEFEFNHDGIPTGSAENRGVLSVYFTGGMGSSTSGGSFNLNNTEYGALVRAVAAATPDGGEKTMNLRMADYVNYYLPDFDLDYNDGERTCQQQMSLHGQITGENWFEDADAYKAFFEGFRFPVQEDHIISVTVGKDDAGRIVSLDLYPENGPSLQYISDVNADGVYFVPIFQDEEGQPLPFESPEGFGIYFAPWKKSGSTTRNGVKMQSVTPDMEQLKLLLPLDETVSIRQMDIDAAAGEAWMLTLEEDGYIMNILDLSGEREAVRIPALSWEPGIEYEWCDFQRSGGYMLVTAQYKLALIDMETKTLLLTAPDWTEQTFGARNFDADDGALRFDGTNLILLETSYYREGSFWAMVFRQDEAVCYGEYDCSLMRGNDDWYYSYVTVNQDIIELK